MWNFFFLSAYKCLQQNLFVGVGSVYGGDFPRLKAQHAEHSC